MRHLATAIFATSLAVVGLVVPSPRATPAAAASPAVNPKVVIIVGPVSGETSSYISDAADAAAAALQGASIVVYMGHGNGWPSKYPPFQTLTKDGLGLNSSAGTSNSNVKYYGESYIDDVTLAPNAVVFLGHLCYSAGNSEGGDPTPPLSVAKQRVDNMAAGWIMAGAQSVVAEPYASGDWGGAAWYIHQLFTTHQTMDQIYKASPQYNNHVLTFASSRSSGYTVEMNTAAPFKRAFTGKPGLLTNDVVGTRSRMPMSPS